MLTTPNSIRLHIGIFGRRNSGKSSLINAITNQNRALVSDIPGTTTDPVYKAMELLPIGPVVIIDTAGLDDQGEIGQLRIGKTLEVIPQTDIALLVLDATSEEYSFELEILERLKKAALPVIGVVNKIDLVDRSIDDIEKTFNIPIVKVSAKEKSNIIVLKDKLFEIAPKDFKNEFIVSDILLKKSMVLLVAPQDIQAPKGRLILPQVQTIRDILDKDCMVLTVKYSELHEALKSLKKQPDLVITDSQVFKLIKDIIPADVPLTSFSILMARYKGDLTEYIHGAYAINSLQDHDKVLICEACTHHPLEGDIGREKLPRWLREFTQKNLQIEVKASTDFDSDLNQYSLIVHCGACMFNRKQMLSRIHSCQEANVPITNYGIAIAYMNGILDRVTQMLKDVGSE